MFGATQVEHNKRLHTVLRRLEEVGVTLNSGKCEFSKPAIKFLGSLIDAEGIRADQGKTQAIVKMEAPQSVSDLRRLLGTGEILSTASDIRQP